MTKQRRGGDYIITKRSWYWFKKIPNVRKCVDVTYIRVTHTKAHHILEEVPPLRVTRTETLTCVQI